MNNNLQNPLSILKAKTSEIWSGCIEVEEPKDPSVSWHIYLLEGKVQYVCSSVGQQFRLDYLWQKLKLGSSCPQLSRKDVSEYIQVCQVLRDKQVPEVDIKKILFRLTREGLANVLSIENATVRLIPAKRINKALVSFGLEQLTTKLEEQIKQGKYVRSFLSSPLSRLYLDQKNALKFYKVWKPKFTTPELETISQKHKLSSFVSLFVAKDSIYQVAAKAGTDYVFLAQQLKQCILEGLITQYPFKELSAEEIQQKNQSVEPSNNADATQEKQLGNPQGANTNAPLIVCIDDSKTVQKQVRMTLEAVGYQVLGILDPTQALKKLSQYKPTVILMDINMPNLNGYDLCSLLRKSQRFKDIPIVMLTGRDGMIDRVRAKIAGSTDYLTKPCDPNKLISLTKALEKSTTTAL